MTSPMMLLVEVRSLCASGEARRLREAAGLSLADIAVDARTTPTNVSRWERGERIPRGEAARRYARTLRKINDARPQVQS
jgi:transcriptional regulator with XRE-family HTH domain